METSVIWGAITLIMTSLLCLAKICCTYWILGWIALVYIWNIWPDFFFSRKGVFFYLTPNTFFTPVCNLIISATCFMFLPVILQWLIIANMIHTYHLFDIFTKNMHKYSVSYFHIYLSAVIYIYIYDSLYSYTHFSWQRSQHELLEYVC